MTQVQKVLDHMQEYGSISTMEAFRKFGITRLASRIFDIRRMGIGVEAETVTYKDQDGETVRYARYSLV